MPGRFVALQLLQSTPGHQSTGRRRRDWATGQRSRDSLAAQMMHLQVVTTALSVSCFLHLSELQRSVKSMTTH